MGEDGFFRQARRGCVISLAAILLALCAMTVSVRYRYPAHPSCGGMLGAGYPALFLCDDWGGGSPTGSWGRITAIDVANGGIRPGGFLVDFLFYSALSWIVLFAAAGIFRKGTRRRDLRWAALISLAFLSGFSCAYLTFRSSSLYLGEGYHRRTPTPVLPTSTSSATAPSIGTPAP